MVTKTRPGFRACFWDCDLRCFSGILMTIAVIYIDIKMGDVLTEGLQFYVFSVIFIMLIPKQAMELLPTLIQRRGRG